jgi:hypothetical protein
MLCCPQLAFEPADTSRSELDRPWHTISRAISVPCRQADAEQLRGIAWRVDALGGMVGVGVVRVVVIS